MPENRVSGEGEATFSLHGSKRILRDTNHSGSTRVADLFILSFPPNISASACCVPGTVRGAE